MIKDKHDARLARIVSWALFSGLAISVALFVAGWLLTARSGSPALQKGPLLSVSRALQGEPTAILECGLVVLMLTPVARVFILALGWALRKDWVFSLIAFCVLSLLGLSVLLGTG
jgi:uncharacterized membrane protein